MGAGRSAGPIVIVGAGLAGLRAAEELRRAEYDGALILLGDEPHLPYDRPPLSKQFVRGETDDTTLRPKEFFDEQRIDLRVDAEVVGVETDAHRVRLADGSSVEYGALIIATGLHPRRIPGFPDLAGVHVLRGHADATALRADLATATSALVIGAGFIGCEVAASFRAGELPVVLVEPQPTPLASVLGEQVGALVARMHREQGVDLRCGIGVGALLSDDAGRVRGAQLSDGSEVAADLVVVGVGSRPATDWLADSGIALAEPSAGGGVLADEVGRTGTEDVWALGDVAAWLHGTGERKRVEHWTNAGEQAQVLAAALLGVAPKSTAAQVPYFWSDQYGLKIQALGTPSAGDDVKIAADDGRKFLAFYAKDGAVTGVVGAGMTGRVMRSRAQIAAGVPVAELL
ncbi:FAD-dependent oxidoreductase [Nocardia callitridis]|uniref:FAD-dependent oxidoreductase n=1 Tax=Nocardia callitridis TaxID=648753 RepID=A0ABP9JVZ0_9NOCA